jgi:hypothetical protein
MSQTPTEHDLLQLMTDLERGGLSRRDRIRLFAVIDEPNPITWRNAFGVVISEADAGRPFTLWHAVFQYTKRQGTVTSIPTRDRLLAAIHHGVKASPTSR